MPNERRAFVFANHGDTIATIAARLMPDENEAAQRLRSWNLHLALRRSPTGEAGMLLGSDIVYLEPPLP